MVTGFTKFEFEEYSEKDIQNTIKDYKNYKKWFKFPAGIKGEWYNVHKSILMFSIDFRLWMGKQAEICEDLLWHPNIW